LVVYVLSTPHQGSKNWFLVNLTYMDIKLSLVEDKSANSAP